MVVLVTGAAGLIGSKVIQFLLDKVQIDIIALDNLSIGRNVYQDKKLTWINIDITSSEFPNVLNKFPITNVIHCAAHPGGRSVKEPVLDVQVNAYGSIKLFKYCADKDIPVIYLSSSAVYGNQPKDPIKETAIVDPGTIYGVCKITNEMNLKILSDAYSLNWTVLRLFATYGSGHNPSTSQGIVNIMLTQLFKGNEVLVKGSLDRIKDMIYVDDVANTIIHFINLEAAYGKIINVGTGVGVSIQDLIKKICAHLKKDFNKIKIIEDNPTTGESMYNVADITLLKEFGVTPSISVDEGLKLFINSRYNI